MQDLMAGGGFLLLVASLVGGGWLLHRKVLGDVARSRLAQDDRPEADEPVRSVRPAVGAGARSRWVAAALFLGLSLSGTALGLDVVIATGAGAVAGVLGHLGVAVRHQRRLLQLEEGLAEAIGLTSSALRAGASPVQALERAARAVRGPARGVLLDLTGRLRLGEEPREALEELGKRAPVESFRLFSLALAVQWQAGGSLERSLAVVARSVRDRVELLRRIHTQSAPTRGSVFAFVAATAAIAWLMHQHDAANLERFLRSDVGSLLVGGAVWLQAIGVLWMWRLSQVRV